MSGGTNHIKLSRNYTGICGNVMSKSWDKEIIICFHEQIFFLNILFNLQLFLFQNIHCCLEEKKSYKTVWKVTQVNVEK